MPGYIPRRGFLSEGEREHLKAKVRTCTICGLELLPGEERAPAVRAHLDCLIALEQSIEQQHDADEGEAVDVTDLEKALIAAQADLANPPKTSTARVPTKAGGSYSYTYAPLPEILDAVRPILNRHGLAISQDVVGESGYVGVLTHLIHGAGRLTSGPVMLPATDPQQAGGVITYLRRYSLCAILGIAADEDTDVKTSPAAEPVDTSTTAGIATKPPTVLAPAEGAGDTTSADGEAAGEAPGGQSNPPGVTKTYPVDPADCDHKSQAGRWLPTKVIDGQARCPRCGESAVIYRESA